MTRRLPKVALLLAVTACADAGQVAIPTTTIRVGDAVYNGADPNERIEVFTNDSKCDIGDIAEADKTACRPYVDRASGTVHLAYRLTVGGNPVPMALQPEAVEVLHDKTTMREEGRVQITPHDPSDAGQVYVLLIDGSGSMAISDEGPGSPSRMDKLQAALLRKDVVEAFFSGGKNAVVPLVFRGGVPAPLGGKWLVQDRAEYRSLIRDELRVGSGYTFLYQAVTYASRGLAQVPELQSVMHSEGTTIIALTDGFNNEDPRDTCGSNGPRLETLVSGLREVRAGKSEDPGYQPDVYTVGLGHKAWRRFKLPDKWQSVDTARLCPGGFSAQIVNNNVELRGVDNAALDWIAKAGSGKSFVKQDTGGLADAFLAAASKRYRWFEMRYRTDPFHLRRRFEVDIRLSAPYEASATVPIHPNAWLDGPPGEIAADGWPVRPSFRASLVVLMGILSLLVAWNYLPAAGFNVRRALFGLVDGGRRPKKAG